MNISLAQSHKIPRHIDAKLTTFNLILITDKPITGEQPTASQPSNHQHGLQITSTTKIRAAIMTHQR